MNMNSSERDTESLLPELYEIEITEQSQKLLDINIVYNETTHNDTVGYSGNKLIIRPDEALIVILVLILWMVAIGLFVHRWGKIRNCEPYTPKFHDAESSHRGSCHDQTNLINKRMSMSTKSTAAIVSLPPSAIHSQHQVPASPQLLSTKGYQPIRTRLRQNSVFVSPASMTPQPSRRFKSALDLHSMIDEAECELV